MNKILWNKYKDIKPSIDQTVVVVFIESIDRETPYVTHECKYCYNNKGTDLYINIDDQYLLLSYYYSSSFLYWSDLSNFRLENLDYNNRIKVIQDQVAADLPLEIKLNISLS